MNTALIQYMPRDDAMRGPTQLPRRSLRLAVPSSSLTSRQIVGIARVIERHCPRCTLRIRSATQLEIAVADRSAPSLPDELANLGLDSPVVVTDRGAVETERARCAVHATGARLTVRQLRALAALMLIEGVQTLHILDAETVAFAAIPRGRVTGLSRGLREFNLITV